MPSRVYVVELDIGAGKRRDPRIPWVYVGSTGRPPKLRFEQHRRGYKSSGLVKRHGLRLRPDLCDDLPSFPRSEQALEAEHERARELASCGFVAHSDGTSYGEGRGDWVEWGPQRLQPVLKHVSAAAADLTECAFQPLTVPVCADLLHGVRGFWVGDYLDPSDPPPAYGLFAHVARESLTAALT